MSILGRLGWHRPPGERWRELLARAGSMGQDEVAALRDEARLRRRVLDSFLLETDEAVHRARAGLAAMPMPVGTDWRWRPPLLAAPLQPHGVVSPANGTGLGDSAYVFHDCDLRAMVLTQIRNRRATDLSPFAIRFEVLGFSGSFLSVSLPLPDEALRGLTRHHVIRLDTLIGIERGIEIFARLNVVNGPNTDQLQNHLGWMKPGMNRHLCEFDLADTEMDERQLEKAWIDLILEQPRMNAVVLREFVVSRHPRADI